MQHIRAIHKTRWIYKFEGIFAMALLLGVFWVLTGMNKLMNSFHTDYNMFPQEYFMLIKIATVFSGMLLGLIFILLLQCFVDSLMVLTFSHKGTLRGLLLTLRKLELEICEKSGNA